MFMFLFLLLSSLMLNKSFWIIFIVSRLCPLLPKEMIGRKRKKTDREKKKKKYASQYLYLQNSYDRETFCTFLPLYLPSVKTILVAE